MAPKRKRPERASGDTVGNRPAPHRPAETALGQHEKNYQDGGGGRGGRAGRGSRRSDRRDSSQQFHPPTPSAASSQRPFSPTMQRPPSSSSHTTQNVPLSAANLPPQPSVIPSSGRSNYGYSIITDDRISAWIKTGRQEVIDHGAQSRNDEDITELSVIYQELLHSVLDSRLTPVEAGRLVSEIAQPRVQESSANNFDFDPAIIFLDTMSITVDVEDIEAESYRHQLRDFLNATDISPALMRQVLDAPFLQQLNLIRDTFVKLGIRQTTNLLYRSANYNLLREETEGYSKLTTELYTTSNTEAPTPEAVAAAFERVKALIGTFDLDVGRVLDILLDVFAAVLIKQFRFFIKLLRISSWWPRNQVRTTDMFAGGLPNWALPESPHGVKSSEEEAAENEAKQQRDIVFWDRAREVHIQAFFELGGRQVADADMRRFANASTTPGPDGDGDGEGDLDWIKTTNTLPPSGNRVAAQLLGFKLRFYNSEAKDDSDIFPANLLFLSALLIKVGFISLCDLYPHIWPFDQDMESLREEKMRELEEQERKNRPGAATNALLKAGALSDDTLPAPPAGVRRDVPTKADSQQKTTGGDAQENKIKFVDDFNQKRWLILQLLSVGALPEALFMLGRFPWLPEAFPEIHLLLHRIYHHSLETVFKQSRPVMEDELGCPPRNIADISQDVRGNVKQGPLPLKRVLRWPYADKVEPEGNSYKFYWDEWNDNIPVCQTVDDVFTLCNTLINLSGVNIGKDASLLSKLASIGVKSLREDPSQPNFTRWQDLLKRLLVPALSLTEPNSAAVNAVWDLLRLYPIAVRYTIYAEWFEGQISRLPAIKAAFARTRLETLSTMKRLSLTNLSTMARTLAKTAYASPGVVFKVALQQIEAYSNLIEVFVECAKYFTPLGYDVLVWSLMNSLGGQERSRTQESSVLLTSKWLQALSRFSGKVFRRYSVMNISPVIQYVNEQLFRGNSTDLVILKELISSMGGIVPDVDFTDAQLQAMTGGEVLRRQTLINLQDKRFESAKSARRLMKGLVEAKLAGRLLINIAQYRQSAIFKVPEGHAHIKFLATMVDDTHQILVQYLDLLRSNLEPDQFDELVPGIMQLINDFGLDVSLAFMIGRASLVYQMTNPKSASSQTQPMADADGDTVMNGESATILGIGTPAVTEISDNKMALDSKDAPEAPAEAVASPPVVNSRKGDQVLDVLQPLVESIQPILPAEVWQRLTPEFYVLFWSLQLGDLAVPQSSYTQEHNRLNKQAEDVMKDRSDMTRAGMNRKDEKKKGLLELAKLIRDEMSSHAERYSRMRFRLTKQCKFWFPSNANHFNATSDMILEQCILPRMLLSASDTEYSFKVIKFLHENRAPNFKLMSLYDRFFNHNRLISMIFSCTVREAEYLGRFLKCILGDLSRWHADKAVYEKEALGLQKDGRRTYLGFATLDEDGKPQTFVEHAPFRDLLYGWHKNLNMALKSSLAGMEWMHIRNSITILKAVLDYFPAVDFMAGQFSKQLKTITEREAASKNAPESEQGHRVDLSVTAQTAFSELQKRQKKWVMVQAFRSNTTGESQEEPKSSDTALGLRPNAPEFKPTRPEGKSQTGADREDGEVNDGKGASSNKVMAVADQKTSGKAENIDSMTEEPKADTAQAPKAENESANKPATPRPASAIPVHVSGRSDAPKPSGLPDRQGHSLPNRPELPTRPDVPFPGRFAANQYTQFRNHDRPEQPPRDPRQQRGPRDPRDSREPRDPREMRNTRDAQDPRDVRDFQASDAPPRPERSGRDVVSDRRPQESVNREPVRSARPEAPPRWNEASPNDRDTRPPRDRGNPPIGRGHDTRPPRAAPAPATPAAQAPQSVAQESSINPERARLLAGDRPEIMDPSRAGLINANRDSSVRSPKDGVRDHNTVRPQSPRRHDRFNADPATPEPGRDLRHGRGPPYDHGAGRNSFAEPPQSWPRDRNAERDSDRGRDFPGPSPASRNFDPDQSRGNQQDPNYGRLNPIQSVADIPSGPRGRGRVASRGPSTNGPPARTDARFGNTDSARPPSPDRQPPSGPASSRGRRGQPGQYDQGPQSVSASPAGIVHPDRMRQVNIEQPQPQLSSTPVSNPSVHPDRIGHIGLPPPPPASHGRRSNMPKASTIDRTPSSAGPTGSRQTPVQDQGQQGTPTGPSSVTERRGQRTRGPISAIERTLAQASSADGGSRNGSRRGPRNLAGSDAQILTGDSPTTTPGNERPDPMRRDIGLDHGLSSTDTGGPSYREPRGGQNGDEHVRGSRREHRDRGERSGRPSRRSSRERSPEREADSKDSRNYRDRRTGPAVGHEAGSGPNPERDMVSRTRSMRDSPSGGNRDAPAGGGRELAEPGRESRHRGGDNRPEGNNTHGRGGENWNGANSRGHGRSGGGPRDNAGRHGDGRRDSGRGDDRGRKRRSEDGGALGNDREKRLRR